MKKKYVKPEIQELRLPKLLATGIRGGCYNGENASATCNVGDTPDWGTADCANGFQASTGCANGTLVWSCTDGPTPQS